MTDYSPSQLQQHLERLRQLREEWERGPLKKSLARGERKQSFETPSGLPIGNIQSQIEDELQLKC